MTNMGAWVPRTWDVLYIPHTKPFKESRSLGWWLFFSFTSGHWLSVQLVKMTGIFFSNDTCKVFDWVFVPSTLTQNPDCPCTLFPSSVAFAYACILHVVSQHRSCAGPVPQTSKQMNSCEKLFPYFFMFRSFKPFRSFSINTFPLSLFSLFICSFCCCFLY